MTAEEAFAASKSYTNQAALGQGAVQIPAPLGKAYRLAVLPGGAE